MRAERKWEVIDLVRRSPLSKACTLEELGIPRSTYFRWQRRYRQQGEVGLVDRRPIKAPLFVTSLNVAEMVKYADNAVHALKVYFANELGALCKRFGIDSHDTAAARGLSRRGFRRQPCHCRGRRPA
jgi:hypothetical protein